MSARRRVSAWPLMPPGTGLPKSWCACEMHRAAAARTTGTERREHYRRARLACRCSRFNRNGLARSLRLA